MTIANVLVNVENPKDSGESYQSNHTSIDTNNTPAPPPPVENPQILAEFVIEEVSIDGMCGVY